MPPDDTRERLRPYMGRIRYFYQDNHGVSAALNKGIQGARGKWFSRLDSDDVWLPTKLERQLKAITALGSEFGACFYRLHLRWKPGLLRWNQDLRLSAFQQAGLEACTEFGRLMPPLAGCLQDILLSASRAYSFCVPCLKR